MTDCIHDKIKLRKHYLQRRNKMPDLWRDQLSANLVSQLKSLFDQYQPSVVHAFIPFGTEVNIYPILEFCLSKSIRLVTPRIQKKPIMLHLVTRTLTEVKKNNYGIRETTSKEFYRGAYDIILVPGVLFHRSGFRIGYGGGYYDHFLAQHPEALKIGIVYPLQITKIPLPIESHDIPVDFILTGKTVIKSDE